VIFVWKFPNFRYHGNRGWFDTNFTHTVKSAEPENPLFGAMATRVCLAKIRMTPFDRPTPKTPSLVQNSGTYLEWALSYGEFCVEISKFSFPWQQGLV